MGYPLLKLGSSGPVVRRLNELLRLRGYSLTQGEVFDQATHDAVLAFQTQQKLKPDGEVGPRTWEALQAGADVACTAAQLLVQGEPSAFALTRPPGHHAAAAAMGGYCYVNNAAVAAQYLADHGCPRVAIIDVDYHHGNGTQQIFEARGDVLFLSIHADPVTEYPYFLGYADERGTGAGEGATHNYPLPFGTTWDGYAEALAAACGVIRAWGPDAIVVSLGVDTYEHDPISEFKLTKGDYPRMGEALASLGRPTMFVMEGGYAVDDIGVNAVSVLTGFEGR